MPSLVGATEVDDQIAHIQLALRKYVARRCPASRLPVELWDIIFEECVPETPEPSLVQAPLSVSQVCRRWRNIALSNPVLWSTLAITTTCRHTEGSRALEALQNITQLWLHRSGARLLSVFVAQTEEITSTGPISLLFEAVLAHAMRLRRLEVHAPETCLFPLESPALALPALEHLKIESPWPQLAASDLVFPLARAPRLSALAILHASFDAGRIDGFDYRQLTELNLVPDVHAPPGVFWTADEALEFLAEAPNLHTLRLVVNDFMPQRRTLAQADALRSLSLEFRDALSGAPRRPARIGAFFSLLYTPNLRRLTLRDRGTPNPVTWPLHQFIDMWPHEQFLAYLGATPLLALTLEHLPLYETEVIECLQQVPQLTELVLEAPARRGSQRNVGDLLLRALTSWNVPPSGVPIASALRSVEFRHCGKRCTEQALISMVDSRMGALQYLRVHRSALPSRELAERVAKWNMVVDVHY
ncbi:hypothetical protein B0H19DRAFT_1095147 [Mycena capillaripes]|nr:hypothetical protein B0H19DRAFT_1095147 [Mycena capillaripes]